ncbi:hypothetical protein YN1_2220 [Nanoarchaeota archaeon]
MDIEKYKEYLKKGYILTKDTCPVCNNILLKDSRTGLEICINCGYKKDNDDILMEKEGYLLSELQKERDIDKIYKILKSLYLIKKLRSRRFSNK